MCCIALVAFYLGQISVSRKGQGGGIVFSCPDTVLDAQRILTPIDKEVSTAASASTEAGGIFMGSKNGTKYYTPGCPASERIKPENIIWFQSVEDATVQGYSKGSC